MRGLHSSGCVCVEGNGMTNGSDLAGILLVVEVVNLGHVPEENVFPVSQQGG